MNDDISKENFWDGDRLGYEEIGRAFTNLIKSIDDDKVISIEAGFGRGKTFFRTAWARQLKAANEVIVELDVQQSDHSGDPVITLLGALLDALPKDNKSSGNDALESAKKIGSVAARTLTRAILRNGADEVIEVLTDKMIDQLEDFDALDGLIKEVGGEVSKAAGQLITAQMTAERVRKEELPEQLEALRNALTEGAKNKRIVVIIDELDRCHPEYAIAFLEATKLVFNQNGFVFCLMVNAEYLENLARHRFGVSNDDEKYLDKFVDIRLKLEPKLEKVASATLELAQQLPLRVPLGGDDAFSVASAAELASKLAVESRMSMRKIKRVLLKVELAMRCYADHPLDASLLIFLAFQDAFETTISQDYLKRSFLTPKEGLNQLRGAAGPNYGVRPSLDAINRANARVRSDAPELLTLERNLSLAPQGIGKNDFEFIFRCLAPHYIPFHRRVLDGVAGILVDD